MKLRNYLSVLCAMAMPAFADNQALIITNADYQYTRNATGPSLVPTVAARLREAGYRVQSAENLSNAEMTHIVSQFAASADRTDHVIYVYLGHMLNDGADTFFAPVDLNAPRADTIASMAMNVNVMTTHAARHSGSSAIFFGWTKPKKQLLHSRKYAFKGAPGLRYGLGEIDIPQGVMVVNGIVQRTVDAIDTKFFQSGISTRSAANATDGYVRSMGYLSLHTYLNRGLRKPIIKPTPEIGLDLEQGFWDFTKQENTIVAYEGFIKRFPNGKYTATAKKDLAKLRADALISPAERTELALNLTRDEKRSIQRALTVLGHDTRGADGLFGPASRRAIVGWQARAKRQTHGFLDNTQVRNILSQGDTKRRTLEEDAKRKRVKVEAEDRAFWRATGASGQEYDLRVYLNKYPDGLYAEIAQKNLDNIVTEKSRESGHAEDRKAWQAAASTNTEQSYSLYLRKFKNGAFVEEANARIRKLRARDANRKNNERAFALEKSMNLGPKMWLIVERQMASSGHNTGKVDGVVDGSTRKALRQFLRNNDLPVTGFMSPNTLARVFIR